METQQPKPGGFKINGVAAILGMVVTFLVGAYVGLHPLWIPFDVSGLQDKGPAVGPPAMATPAMTAPATTESGRQRG